MDEENNNNNINNHVGNGGRDEELHQLFKGMMLGLIRETTASWAHNRQPFDQQQQQPPFDNNTPIGSDIKLRLPDKYDGTRDISTIENFFSQIDKLKTLKGWDDYKTYNIVTTILDGRALAWVNYLEKLDNESTPRTWTELKEVLETKFKPTNGEDMYRDLLWKTKQETSVQEYVDKFMDICILIPDIGDKDLCDRFVRGLKSKELIAQIRTIPINTRTLEVATQAALAYEAAHDPAIAQSHATFARITPQPPRNSRYEPMDLDVIDRRNDNRSGRLILF